MLFITTGHCTYVLEDICDNELALNTLGEIQGVVQVLCEFSEDEIDKSEVSSSAAERLKALDEAIYIFEGQQTVHLPIVM